MPTRAPRSNSETTSIENERIILSFSGGNADRGILDLQRYALTLQGWNDFFKITGSLYQDSATNLEGEKLETSLDIKILAEEKGSFEVLLVFTLGAVAGGIIGNRSDALVVWTFRSLLKWYLNLLSTYRTKKRQTTNVEEIVAALEAMADSAGIPLNPRSLPKDEVPSDPDDADQQDAIANEFSSKRLLVEKIDNAVQNGIKLLAHDCKLIQLINSDGLVELTLDESDYQALHRPLTLPPPEGIWKRAKVRFERINVKTGVSLVYLEIDGRVSRTTDHARISDPDIHHPPNVYTAAFNAGTLLQVWARQIGAEKGRLNLMWEITVMPPAQRDLFGQDS